jgi:adenylylsulfate kinase-like enzyme
VAIVVILPVVPATSGDASTPPRFAEFHVQRRSASHQRRGAILPGMHAVTRSDPLLAAEGRAITAQPATIWLTGRRGSGRRTLGRAVVAGLAVAGRPAIVLDDARVGAAAARARRDAGGEAVDRVACAAELAMALVGDGVIAVVVASSPRVWDRERARREHEVRGLPFAEVFLDTPAEVCAARDSVDPTYEAPPLPDLVIRPGPLLPAVLSIVELV